MSGHDGQGARRGPHRAFGDLPGECRQWAGDSSPCRYRVTSLFGLDLAGRRVVIAGAGRVASRRVRRFLTAGALVRVVAPDASDDIVRHASHGDLEWVARAFEPADLDDAWLVLAATDDAPLNDRIANWADERR